jgi:hypothetical protein
MLSRSVHHRLNAYCLAATAAGVGLLALAVPAGARIVYTPANMKIPPGSVPLDLNHDGVVDFSVVYSGHSGATFSGFFTCKVTARYSGCVWERRTWIQELCLRLARWSSYRPQGTFSSRHLGDDGPLLSAQPFYG